MTVAKSFALSESEGQPAEWVDLAIKMSPSLLVLAATLLVFAQTPRTGMVQSVTPACMAWRCSEKKKASK